MDKSQFRTLLNIPKSNKKISLNEPIFTIGSCFSDVIGRYLENYKFSVLSNPYGTVYNPISIFKLLSSSEWNDKKFIERDGVWFHHDAHSSFFNKNKSVLLEQLKTVKKQSYNQLKSAKWLIITLGTSFVYRQKSFQEVVANCHKVPQEQFSKEMLSVKEIIQEFDHFYSFISDLNSDLKIILTLSPVRHTKDGFEENSASKARLRIACDEIQKQHESVFYFPSYEIMLDDLRDYRFYKPDLIHPNEIAEEYIWERFQETYFDAKTLQFISDWEKIRSAIKHRPFNPESPGHQKFVQSTLLQLKKLSVSVDTSREEEILKKQLR